jgi:hypothetical protein
MISLKKLTEFVLNLPKLNLQVRQETNATKEYTTLKTVFTYY